MKRIAWLITVVVVLVAGSGFGAEARARAGKRADRCYGIQVVGVSSSVDASAPRLRRRGRRLSVQNVDALEFRVGLPAGLAGSHRVELKLYTPHGDLYQTLTVVHSSASDEPNHESERRRGRRRRWEFSVLRLPVAATTIVRSSLYGAWRAEAYLNGSTRTCSRPRVFTLEP